IFYVEKARVKLTYSKWYKTLQNIVHRGRGLHYFVTWRPMPLKNFAAKVRKVAVCRKNLQAAWKTGRKTGSSCHRSPSSASSYF
ncbi:MAG: hypothetical protein ACK55Z_12345, partial [bacterium]